MFQVLFSGFLIVVKINFFWILYIIFFGVNFRIKVLVIWIFYYFWVDGICKDRFIVIINFEDDYKLNNKQFFWFFGKFI